MARPFSQLIDPSSPLVSRVQQNVAAAVGPTIAAVNALRISRGTVAPAAGQVGDVVVNTAAGPNSFVGWYCTSSAGGMAAWSGFGPMEIEAWREVGATGQPAFANSWVNFGGVYNTAAFCIDSFGVVRLKGLVKSGTITGSVFTLPAGYRPAKDSYCMVVSNNAVGVLEICSDGRVLTQVGNNTHFSLEPVSFRV